jgi:small subunit ribosomal protein S1
MVEGHPADLAPTEDYWQALLEQGEMAPADRASGRRPVALSGKPGAASDLSSDSPNGAAAQAGPGRDELWNELDAWFGEGRSFTAPVIGCNKGGLLVRVGDGIGFLPASQLKDLPCSLGTDDLRRDLEQLVGRDYTLRLIELDRSRNRVICSERAAQWDDESIDSRLDDLEGHIGSEIEGVVRSLCDFGAFVDLGNIDGLVHISEISWQRVGRPAEVLEVGQPVRVIVMSVDHAARRVGLSLKRLEQNPWPQVCEHYAVGNVIDATVTNVVDFGAFASVEEGVEGLIHISELSEGPFTHPGEIVTEGENVRVRVLHIDPDSRRLGLSLRQA